MENTINAPKKNAAHPAIRRFIENSYKPVTPKRIKINMEIITLNFVGI